MLFARSAKAAGPLPPRLKAFLCALLLAVPIACSRDLPAARGAVADEVAFEGLFLLQREIQLEQPGDHVVASPNDVQLWNGALVLVDGVESNAKVYDLTGRLVRVIGRAGHGPGELSEPFAAAPLADGRIAILDSRLRLSFFSASGEYQARWQLNGGDAAGLAAIRGGKGLLVAIRMPAEDSIGNSRQYHLHEYDLNGRRLRSFREVAQTANLYEVNFHQVFAAVLDETVVSIARNSNRVLHVDLDAGRERWSQVGSTFYRAPAWPRERIGSMEEMARWVNSQMWTFDISALDSARYMVRFSNPNPLTGSVGWFYSIATVDGREIATIGPTERRIDLVHAGLAYSVDIGSDGRCWLSVYQIRDLNGARSASG